MDGNSASTHWDRPTTNSYFAYNGKLMLISLVVIVAICIVLGLAHSYARWLHHSRRHNRLGLHRHRTGPRSIFNFGPTDGAPRKGLDRSVLLSLPTFFYSAHDPPIECAVCLSEFGVNESGRILPKCNHRFHVGCIDMWFDSNSNCPLCRALVKPVGNPGRVICERSIADSGSSSGSASTCEINGDQMKNPELIGITVEEPSSNRVS
ncbi:RING-H2 finger protein [Actinidia chinensis var. chinensis]|uniref:RING-H2 finger protein n=1 Tax=Actinidia chinensis var. chinensis TaxID=1590841 RepID=A0A2R6P5U1_ACTCC|nr:RING-H2 finger protein [Actinidia chinensis var. chinensis]